MTEEQTLEAMYAAFNARDIDGVFAYLSNDIAWANAMEGTHVHGKDKIRGYWTHQWSVVDPHVEPLKITKSDNGKFLAEVHQVVKDLTGKVILDEKVVHSFTMKAGRVTRFDIPSETGFSTISKS